MGRTVVAPRSRGTMARMDFEDLCAKPLGAADYMALCDRFDCLMVENVPQLTAQKFNEARRFVTLIDCIYETKTRLLLACEVSLSDLMMDFEQQIDVESMDGDEEVHAGADDTSMMKETVVVGQGGSSSSHATTLIPSKDGTEVVEWSATGRIGVSLAQLSSVQEVSFSFRRAESRLVEINHPTWGIKKE
jgi:peroxisome-assembly ATPase